MDVLDPRSPYYEKNKYVLDQLKITTDAIEELESSDIKSLDEYIFANVFFPYFIGESNIYNVTNELWVKVAGGNFKPVNIVDKAGNVLFQVPPILNRGAIKPIVERGAGIEHVIKQAELMGHLHPSQGDAFLKVELEKRAFMINTQSVNVDEAILWNDICTRYKREPIFNIVKKDSTTISNVEGNSAFGEYEFS